MDSSRLKRNVCPMPEYIKKVLIDNNLMDKYEKRPPYQQNDYIRWITKAKKKETIDRRLHQMLVELECGDTYMGMYYNAKT